MQYKTDYIRVKGVIQYSLLICFLLKPMGVTDTYPIVNFVFRVGKILSLTVIILNYIKIYRIEPKVNFGDISLMIFWTVYIVNDLAIGENSGDIINNAITSVAIIWFVRDKLSGRFKAEMMMSLKIISLIYILLEDASIIMKWFGYKPFGSADFLGRSNYAAFETYALCGVYFFLRVFVNKKLKVTDWALILLNLWCFKFLDSTTTVAASLILIILLLIDSFGKLFVKKIGLIGIMAVLIILLLLIVKFNIQELFAEYLMGIKDGRGITLDSRTIIWDKTIAYIKKRPICGWGDYSNLDIYGASHAHNIFLELLLRTGIVGTISYIFFLLATFKRKYMNYNAYRIMIYYMIMILMMCFMDFYPTMQYMYLFFAVMHSARYVLVEGANEIIN